MHEHLVRVDVVLQVLEREHQLEEAAAKARDLVAKVISAFRERVDEAGELPFGVDPHDDAALTDLARDFGGIAPTTTRSGSG